MHSDAPLSYSRAHKQASGQPKTSRCSHPCPQASKSSMTAQGCFNTSHSNTTDTNSVLAQHARSLQTRRQQTANANSSTLWWHHRVRC